MNETEKFKEVIEKKVLTLKRVKDYDLKSIFESAEKAVNSKIGQKIKAEKVSIISRNSEIILTIFYENGKMEFRRKV